MPSSRTKLLRCTFLFSNELGITYFGSHVDVLLCSNSPAFFLIPINVRNHLHQAGGIQVSDANRLSSFLDSYSLGVKMTQGDWFLHNIISNTSDNLFSQFIYSLIAQIGKVYFPQDLILRLLLNTCSVYVWSMMINSFFLENRPVLTISTRYIFSPF